ncbi:MAG: hypothetical protein EB072_02975 [Betaproteobacteria bacterium]|nr:hypothetical protein [Betaproteobacteria bacterium]
MPEGSGQLPSRRRRTGWPVCLFNSRLSRNTTSLVAPTKQNLTAEAHFEVGLESRKRSRKLNV